ncbi:MAG: tetratricopeptide repeat protein [Ferruginibacter sp.]
MKNIKIGIMLLASVFFANAVFAQSMDEGKSFMYYERYKSAKMVFQKLLAADPNNEEAAYLLGQSYILPDDRTTKDLEDAKALYQSKLTTNPNSPLLIAGMGHIALIEGKKEDARSRFETAISLSQGKSIPVLNAVGFANGNPDSKNGDAAYAIDKLKQATQIKKFNDPDVYANLGDAYRKFADGGNAISSYEAALALNPKYARATYRIGKVYQTQGASQEPIYMKYFNEAIAMDPKYAPAYYNLFQYYYENNVTRSAEYLDKWLANSDDDPKACYYKASLKYAQGLFNDALSKADECIAAGGTTPYPNLYGLKALAYNRLKDSMNAKTSYEEYFKRQSPDKIGAGDYSTYAALLLKFPGNEARAAELVEKAVLLDSLEVNKVSYLKGLAQAYEAQKNFKEAANWYNKILSIKKDYGKVDLYNAGYDFFRSGTFDSSIIVFNKYLNKFPDDIFGYYMVGKANWGIDTTMVMGLANPYFEKAIQVGEVYPDKSKIKSQLLGSYKYMIAYAANILKNKDTALAYAEKALALDPTDQETISNRDAIKNMKMTPVAPPKASTYVNSKGDKVVTTADGTMTTTSKDGSVSIITKAGKVTTIKNGVTTIIENGKITTIGKDGKTTTLEPPTPPIPPKPAPVTKKTDTAKKKVKAKSKK